MYKLFFTSVTQPRAAIGGALTPEQQMPVSKKIASGPDSFIAWVATSEGKELVGMIVDEFVAVK